MSRKRQDKKQGASQPAKRRPARQGLWIAGGVVAVIVAVVTYSLFATGLVGGGAMGTTNGELAPDVTLSTADGQISLSELRGQPALLYFSFPG